MSLQVAFFSFQVLFLFLHFPKAAFIDDSFLQDRNGRGQSHKIKRSSKFLTNHFAKISRREDKQARNPQLGPECTLRAPQKPVEPPADFLGSHPQLEIPTPYGTLSTLRTIFKNKEARSGEEKVIPEERQLRKPIERLRIARLAPFTLGLFFHVHCLRHEGRERLWTIVLQQVVLKVAGGLGLLRGWLPERVACRLPVVLGWEIPPTGTEARTYEKWKRLKMKLKARLKIHAIPLKIQRRG
ncbi:hypothetical protein Cgig2_003114 [Carnegiea gigantea]|uniref:Secreted protein n=1 Tax=Carnegiea gigantea TaxID=171969 RepID=A0A9Q1JN73_9CARY|nr:hypothetical protein Cgig2_003114 [Carnegiea gigantea]